MTPKLRKRVLWACAPIIVMLIVLFVVSAAIGDPRLQSRARREWKERAIADVAWRSADSQMLANEIAILKAEAARGSGDGWVGTNVLLMTNGEHLVYSQVCSKQPGRIHDIFIARGSDGKWYYSTYHFCIGMMTASVEEPPGSLPEFASRFFAREFDGNSDQCLETTWPVKR